MTPFRNTSRQSLALLATACLLSVALPAGTAMAQKVKDKSGSTASSTATSSSFSVDIPTIDAIDSNLEEATLRDIFSGNIVDNADALAGLTATSITIPEIIVTGSTTIEGETNNATVTFSDLVLSDITDGVAASVSLTGMSLDAGEDGSGEFGMLSASGLDIGGVLGMYGLVDAAGQTELRTIYTDFSFEGGSFEADDVSCTMGGMTAAEFKARPLSFSLVEMMALAESLEEQGDDPSPELLSRALHMYAEVFTAFESAPAEFAGFDCSGTDDEGRALTFSVANMSMDGMSPGFYPAIAVDGIDITVEGDGTVQVGNITFKEMDLSGPIAVLASAPARVDEDWFIDNARGLIPAFAGFAFSDVVFDVPDPDTGERINASIGAFDLSLGRYINGIPSDVQTTASNIVVDLPEDTSDEQIQQLIALGITSIDAGFTFDASWNEAEDTISINDISVTGADLATVKLAGTVANATEALFAVDENEALAAAMDIAISQLKLDVTEAGLSDIILASVAAEQGSDPATMRPVFAGLAQGTIVGMLAGTAEAQKVGAAINAFVSGKAKYLTIELTAKEEPGLSMTDFMAAESDPASLIGKVTIDASAK